MTADLIDNLINDWVRLSIEIPLEARLSSWLPSVLENDNDNDNAFIFNHKHDKCLRKSIARDAEIH